MKSLPLLTAALCSLALAPAANAVTTSIWVNDGDDLGRLDFSSATSATFTYIGKFGTGASGPAGTSWSDSPGTTANVMLDIAWNPATSTLYGISSAQGATNSANSYLWSISTTTGAATLITGAGNNIPGDNQLPGGTAGVDSYTLTNALGMGSNGQLLTAISTNNTLFSLNTATNAAATVGSVMGTSPRYYSSGDIETHLGQTYSVVSQTIYTGGDGVLNYLVALNLTTPSASTIVGAFPGSFDTGFGLASISYGLYAFDGDDKTVHLVNPATAALTPVAITGSTAALSGFGGASAVPEPGPAVLVLTAVGVMGLQRRRRIPG